MRYLKIILSVFFVLAISTLVVRSCVHKKPGFHEVVPKKVTKKKVRAAGREKAQKEVVITKEGSWGPRMAIILDDWGNNFSLTKNAMSIQRPVTLAILPHLPYSEKIAEEAYRNGLGVMLHMPMQPENQTDGLEPNTLSPKMSDGEIIYFLDSAIKNIPHVEGVNNHQGSGAVADLRMMKLILGHLAAKDLFFLDSYTTAKTVAPQVAKQFGIKFTRRDVFIDNEMEPEAIKTQIRVAIKKALLRGRVVVIGHARKMTLLTVKQMVSEIEAAGIQFVLAKDLVE